MTSTDMLQIHPFHNAEDGPLVILVSNDGRAFTVDLKTLAKSSSFFENMLELPIKTSDINDPPSRLSDSSRSLDIDADELVLEYFVNIVKASQPHIPITNLEQAMELLALCRKYGVRESSTSKIRDHSLNLGKTQPWEFLRLASFARDPNDNDLCRIALGYLSWNQFLMGDKGNKTSFWERIESLSPTWRTYLLENTLGDPSDHLWRSDCHLPDIDRVNREKYWQKMMDVRLSKILLEERIFRACKSCLRGRSVFSYSLLLFWLSTP
ncbi:hypothetical protein I302_103954 [Kwoniella bestiolae CBS 10118]|uniref:BTB domain-containing protein n=1 Tax=Kwoniella bestiolae CBS 10118 TaxID=1296100 RepID=A0A1B9G9Y4_9TREE|nr:hypothetical protein I302_02660 [Kwoniella bestiolae CBS 10118]OCF27811.1 hypothetical protein I302_02660 [Kwoniella bestiolae CBS 10118]